MVNWTRNFLRYTKKPYSFGQTPQSSSKVLFTLDFLNIYGDLYCCVKYSNIEYQDEIFKRNKSERVFTNTTHAP
jgi:hypothetical protein